MTKNNDREIDFSRYTKARLGLGHTGGHLKCRSWLSFQQDFAQAKDALSSYYDETEVTKLAQNFNLNTLQVHSQAEDLAHFLARPDLGKRLAMSSVDVLAEYVAKNSNSVDKDILIIISGGLSPAAIQHNIPHFLPALLINLQKKQLSLAPLIFTPRSRVAFGDEINAFFKAKITVMLIGERPGLTTPDSLGIYFTYAAKPGCTDAVRNCISNIHQNGLSCEQAVSKLVALIEKALHLKITGIALKDDVISTTKHLSR